MSIENILFIISDQHRADHMGCAGNPVIKTPNLDQLAREGIRFTNAFCTNPMCMPNRATMLTGYYPNTHKVRSNGMILSPDIPTITETLVNLDWRTAAFGKLHHQFNTHPYRIQDKSAESFGDWVFPKEGYYPVRGISSSIDNESSENYHTFHYRFPRKFNRSSHFNDEPT